MNQINVVGRIAKEINLREDTNNNKYCIFDLAVNRGYKNKEGQREVDFLPCAVFGNKANILNEYTRKGNKVALTGRVQTRLKDEQKEILIIVEKIDLIESRESNYKEPKWEEPEEEANLPF